MVPISSNGSVLTEPFPSTTSIGYSLPFTVTFTVPFNGLPSASVRVAVILEDSPVTTSSTTMESLDSLGSTTKDPVASLAS